MHVIFPVFQAVALSLSSLTAGGWQPVGEAEALASHAGGTVTLDAETATTGGILSTPFDLPTKADALLVEVELTSVDQAGLTIAVLDADSGRTIGYWLNPVEVQESVVESAVIRLAANASAVRIFVGTDDRASRATAKVQRVAALRLSHRATSVQFGVAVTPEESAGQTFTAAGDRFQGMSFRTRFTRPIDGAHPDLTARLYRWQDNPGKTRQSEPLAELVVPGRLIPADSRGIERDLFLPFDAPTVKGQKYYVELSNLDASPENVPPLLFFAGPDAFGGGETYRGNRPLEWDATTEIYQIAE